MLKLKQNKNCFFSTFQIRITKLKILINEILKFKNEILTIYSSLLWIFTFLINLNQNQNAIGN